METRNYISYLFRSEALAVDNGKTGVIVRFELHLCWKVDNDARIEPHQVLTLEWRNDFDLHRWRCQGADFVVQYIRIYGFRNKVTRTDYSGAVVICSRDSWFSMTVQSRQRTTHTHHDRPFLLVSKQKFKKKKTWKWWAWFIFTTRPRLSSFHHDKKGKSDSWINEPVVFHPFFRFIAAMNVLERRQRE